MIDEVEQFISAFNSNPEIKKKTEGKTRTVSIDITDIDDVYYFLLKDGQLTEMEKHPKIDIKISMDRKTLAGLMNGTIKAGDVYNKGLKVDASWGDLLLLTKVLK